MLNFDGDGSDDKTAQQTDDGAADAAKTAAAGETAAA
jgi:hypothetical protein